MLAPPRGLNFKLEHCAGMTPGTLYGSSGQDSPHLLSTYYVLGTRRRALDGLFFMSSQPYTSILQFRKLRPGEAANLAKVTKEKSHWLDGPMFT